MASNLIMNCNHPTTPQAAHDLVQVSSMIFAFFTKSAFGPRFSRFWGRWLTQLVGAAHGGLNRLRLRLTSALFLMPGMAMHPQPDRIVRPDDHRSIDRGADSGNGDQAISSDTATRQHMGAKRTDFGPHDGLSPDHPSIATACMTPLAWRAAQPHGTALVFYIDIQTGQPIAMAAMTEAQIIGYLTIPLFARQPTAWQAQGMARLLRMNFSPAKAFAEQQDALTTLKNLFATRNETGDELTRMDQAILETLERVRRQSMQKVKAVAPAPDTSANLNEPAPLDMLEVLLRSRQHGNTELARLDTAITAALQTLGVQLSDRSAQTACAPPTAARNGWH